MVQYFALLFSFLKRDLTKGTSYSNFKCSMVLPVGSANFNSVPSSHDHPRHHWEKNLAILGLQTLVILNNNDMFDCKQCCYQQSKGWQKAKIDSANRKERNT